MSSTPQNKKPRDNDKPATHQGSEIQLLIKQ